MTQALPPFTLAYYSGDRKTGSIQLIQNLNGKYQVSAINVGKESGREKSEKPLMIGVTSEKQVVLLDPVSKQIQVSDSFPADAFPAHIYSDPVSARDWFMNDGDKDTGNDTLNCGDKGSSVSVVENTSSKHAKFLKTICVGRGHHQATFSFPSDAHPNIPKLAYISNLQDGSISVVGNDPERPDSFLKCIATINLCEADKEDGVANKTPNNSFPHGLVYSQASGKIYNLNNGYGTVAVINPVSNTIERLFKFKGHSNLFITPDGRYIIGRGADRKSDTEHVIAKLTVFDVLNEEIKDSLDLKDIYISKYFFNPEGTKLYLSTSSSGSPEQQLNLKTDALLVFDLRALPSIQLEAEHRLGAPTGTLDFVQDKGKTVAVFSSNSALGLVKILDGLTSKLIDEIPAGPAQSHSRLWKLPDLS